MDETPNLTATQLDNLIKARDAYEGAIAEGKTNAEAEDAAREAVGANKRKQFLRRYGLEE
jgi:hypothetical protein